jgi:GntR family transcriptional regulator/MocR family aminotransferase
LPAEYSDHHIAQAAKTYGMAVSALSAFACNGCEPQNGLVLGYGNTSVDQYAGLLQRLTTIAMECMNLDVKKAT